MNSTPTWICCQIGAREHYAIPRSLHQTDQLAGLITDAWVSPQSFLHRVPLTAIQFLGERYHPDLADAPVVGLTRSLMQFELKHRFQRTATWDRIMARNQWFQQESIQQLKNLRIPEAKQPILFAYSYAASELFRYAKSQGWCTVLGQIDPGPVEEQIVVAEHQKYPELAPAWQPVPPLYWERWRSECDLSDRILVNSNWSKQALQQAGIAEDKIDILPLAYTPAATKTFQRTYPDRFSKQRPLRVLFLGQVILRKGVAAILEAAQLLQDEPIQFWMVGPVGIERSQPLPNLRWFGSVPRSQVQQYYQQADVFLFPTLSDGFGLTQLEAQAWQLPLIVSRCCGEVVKNDVNGIVLPQVSAASIAHVLSQILAGSIALSEFIPAGSSSFNLNQMQKQLEQIKHKLLPLTTC